MAVRQPKGKAPKAPKSPLPTVEVVASKVLTLFSEGEKPVLWKAADVKKRLLTKERPLLAEALARLETGRQVLVLKQGKTEFYLFAGPLREWLAAGGSGSAGKGPTEDLFAVYARLVRQSGGFPDVKIVSLREALHPATAGTLVERLVALWREGRATFGQGDWSLADDASRDAAVELNGERYLLVRLDDESAGGA